MVSGAIQLDSTVNAISISAALSNLKTAKFSGSADIQTFAQARIIGGHRVYNFEVAETHTYIADGVRVHNKSILSFLSPAERLNVDWDTFRDDDPNVPGRDYVELHFEENGNAAGTTVYKVETENGQQVAKGYTTKTNDKGQLVQIQITKDSDGKVIEVERELKGAAVGEAVGSALTPFLTNAVVGEDGSIFERYASDTLLGTFLENTLEFEGGFLHDQIISGGAQNASFEAIKDFAFEDLPADLLQNAFDNAQSILNQWIMVEIFGNTFSDSIGGQLAEGLTNQLVNSGTTLALREVVELLDFDDAASLGLSGTDLSASFELTSIGALAASIVIRDVLPGPETENGQVASAVSSAAISALVAGPAGIVFAALGGNVIGNLVDSIFPEKAWYHSQFNESTGQFETVSRGRDNGGDYSRAEAIVEGYLDLLNDQTEAFRSTDNNFDEIGVHRIGYRNSQSYATNQFGEQIRVADSGDALKTFFLYDMANVDFQDGALIFKEAIDAVDNLGNFEVPFTEVIGETTGGEGGGERAEYIYHPGTLSELFNELQSNLTIASEYLRYLENQETIDLTIQADPQSNYAAGWAATFLFAEELGLTNAIKVEGVSDAGVEIYTSSGDDNITVGTGSDEVHSFDGNDVLHGLQGNDQLFAGSGADTVFAGEGNDTLYGGDGKDFLDGGAGVDNLFGGVGNDTLQGSGGGDTFHFAGLVGHDEIRDFSTAEFDRIVLDGYGGDEKTVYLYDDDDDAVIYFDENSTVRVSGISTEQFTFDTIFANFVSGSGWNVERSRPDDFQSGSGGSQSSDGSTSQTPTTVPSPTNGGIHIVGTNEGEETISSMRVLEMIGTYSAMHSALMMVKQVAMIFFTLRPAIALIKFATLRTAEIESNSAKA